MTAIKSLSDKELLDRTFKLRRREHTTTLEILIHLNEIERRRLHLKLGYRSLFDYCTKHLKYSASAAGRRIQTARCVRLHPEVYELLEKERVNLTTISLVARILTHENKHRILDAICDKTQREVEEIASRYRPPIALRDMVKPVQVRVPDKPGGHSIDSPHGRLMPDRPQPGGDSHFYYPLSELSLDCSQDGSSSELSLDCPQDGVSSSPASSGQTNSAISSHTRCGGRTFATEPQSGGESLSGNANSYNALSTEHSRSGSDFGTESGEEPMTVVQQKLLIQFLADDAFMQKYEEARSLLSQRLPDTSFANVFDALISEFLEHHSPARRKERRDARREQRKTEPAGAQRPKTRPAPMNSSHAPAPARTQQATVKPAITNPDRATAQTNSSSKPAPQRQAQRPQTIDHTPSRHIPAAIRDEVFTRDKGRCTYIGKTGKRCESTQALQIDHIVPFARGGPATAPNLRLLCAKHNRIAAEEVFGETFTRQFQTRELFPPQRE